MILLSKWLLLSGLLLNTPNTSYNIYSYTNRDKLDIYLYHPYLMETYVGTGSVTKNAFFLKFDINSLGYVSNITPVDRDYNSQLYYQNGPAVVSNNHVKFDTIIGMNFTDTRFSNFNPHFNVYGTMYTRFRISEANGNNATYFDISEPLYISDVFYSDTFVVYRDYLCSNQYKYDFNWNYSTAKVDLYQIHLDMNFLNDNINPFDFDGNSYESYYNGYNNGYESARPQIEELQNEVNTLTNTNEILNNRLNSLDNVNVNLNNMIWTIFDSPLRVISQMLNFSVFGVNIATMLFGMLTLLIVIWIIRKVI